MSISNFIVKARLHFKANNSNKKMLCLVCKDENYEWKLIPNKIRETKVFRITTYNQNHTCSEIYKKERYKHAIYKIIANA